MIHTRTNHTGREYVVRVPSSPSLDGKGTANSKRKCMGKIKADGLEYHYANIIDGKAQRARERKEYRLQRRALKGLKKL